MPHKVAVRLSEFDVRERLAPNAPVWLVQLGFAAFCIGVEIIVRVLINQAFPGAAPFALIYPAILAATLFAGWPCGLMVLAVSEMLTWYFALPAARNFVLADPAADGSRLIVIFIAGSIVVFLASAFRDAARSAARTRTGQLADRDLLLREVEHRTKNNFAMVSSLIDIQRRRSDNEDVKTALSAVLTRVESFSRAHSQLHRADGDMSAVNMKSYIGELSEALAQALTLQSAVTLSFEADDATMDRDRAATIGLLINELVTNAAKHAFQGRERGAIKIKFHLGGDGYRLVVTDDGIGIDPAQAEQKGGLGQRLVEAFARQANGTLTTDSDGAGTRVTIDFKA